MIREVQGNLLEADVEALVNTVNCVGVMGKGIALQFKKAFPDNFKDYEKACREGKVQPGRMFLVDLHRLQNPRYIINFPTKKRWKGNSRLEDIEAGLIDLVRLIKELGVRSVAMPPLGCGLGGLDWGDVKPRIERIFTEELPEVVLHLYPPQKTPAADALVNRTTKPAMTEGRAAIIGLMRQYVELGYTLTLLEIQKLAYFLQQAGQPLRLDFQRNRYGPYADKLRQVLNHIEGHFIQGYGAGENRPGTVITLLPGAGEEADAVLKNHPETQERFQRVAELVEGFESPYGMELLATVHWAMRQRPEGGAEQIIEDVQNWSPRKRMIMKPEHIAVAWRRIKEHSWLLS